MIQIVRGHAGGFRGGQRAHTHHGVPTCVLFKKVNKLTAQEQPKSLLSENLHRLYSRNCLDPDRGKTFLKFCAAT